MIKRVAAVLIVLALATFAFAQNNKKNQNSAERSVSGTVSDADGKPVSGAVVQLENKKTLQVRSFISKEQGDYFFNGLSTDVDYELKASAQGKSSSVKTLSTFDSRKQAVMNLQLK